MAHLMTQTGLLYDWFKAQSKTETPPQGGPGGQIILKLVKSWNSGFPNSGQQEPNKNAGQVAATSSATDPAATSDIVPAANWDVVTTFQSRGAGDFPQRRIVLTGTTPYAAVYIGYVLYVEAYPYGMIPLLMGDFSVPISVAATPFTVTLDIGQGTITSEVGSTGHAYAAGTCPGARTEVYYGPTLDDAVQAKWIKGTADPTHINDLDVQAATLLATCTEQRDPSDVEFWQSTNKSVANDTQQPFYEATYTISKPSGLTGVTETFDGVALYRAADNRMIMLIVFSPGKDMTVSSSYGCQVVLRIGRPV